MKAVLDARIKEPKDWHWKILAKVRQLHSRSRPRNRRRVEVDKADIAGNSRLVPQRHHLHGRNVQ